MPQPHQGIDAALRRTLVVLDRRLDANAVNTAGGVDFLGCLQDAAPHQRAWVIAAGIGHAEQGADAEHRRILRRFGGGDGGERERSGREQATHGAPPDQRHGHVLLLPPEAALPGRPGCGPSQRLSSLMNRWNSPCPPFTTKSAIGLSATPLAWKVRSPPKTVGKTGFCLMAASNRGPLK